MTTSTSDGGAGTGSGSGGTGPGRFLRAAGDYAALWLAIGRMTGVLLADVARDIAAEARARHHHARNGGTR